MGVFTSAICTLTFFTTSFSKVPQVRARLLGANLGAVGHTTFRTFRKVPSAPRLAGFETWDSSTKPRLTLLLKWIHSKQAFASAPPVP
jgi:hypothetical protein